MTEIRYCKKCDSNSVIYKDLEGWYCCNCRKFVEEEIDHLYNKLKENLSIKGCLDGKDIKITLLYKNKEISFCYIWGVKEIEY